MTGLLLVHANRAVLSPTAVLSNISNKAKVSVFLGAIGIISSIFLKNDFCLKASLLWTAASCSVGYFTRKNGLITVNTPTIQTSSIWNALPNKAMTPKEFVSHAKALYESRKAAPETTHEQQKKFYHLMSISHSFSPEVTAQIPKTLRVMQLFRPYMEQTQFLNRKIDLKRQITNPALSLATLKHRDFHRWQALVEIETMGQMSREPKVLAKTMKWVFEMIDNGILENAKVQGEYQKRRGDSEEQRSGEDDALEYFRYKFLKRSYPPNHPYSKDRFQNVAPIVGKGSFRTTSFVRYS